MTPNEFNDVTFNDLDAYGIRISRSSQVSIVNGTEIALNAAQSTYFINCETTDKTILYMYVRITESG